LKEFREKTGRDFNILDKEEERELREKGVEYLANRNN